MKQTLLTALAVALFAHLFNSQALSLPQHVLDFDGDATTDFVVTRNAGGAGTQSTWFVLTSPGVFSSTPWGISTDTFIDGDFDGDHRSDFAVWRGGAQSYFFVLRSMDSTFLAVQFGISGDDPTVVGDYDGDGKTDPAVYRPGATAGGPSYWYYLSSINGSLGVLQWGLGSDFPAPGDYDGDHRADVAVQRDAGGGAAVFFVRNSLDGSLTAEYFGNAGDFIVPGDYDGDGKTDIAVRRASGGNFVWYYDPSSVAGVQALGGPFGSSATDYSCQGDYDGDGKTDFAVWRPSTTAGQTAFYVNKSTGGILAVAFGQNLDYPVANFNTH